MKALSSSELPRALTRRQKILHKISRAPRASTRRQDPPRAVTRPHALPRAVTRQVPLADVSPSDVITATSLLTSLPRHLLTVDRVDR